MQICGQFIAKDFNLCYATSKICGSILSLFIFFLLLFQGEIAYSFARKCDRLENFCHHHFSWKLFPDFQVYKYTNFVVNADSFYANFTYRTFQKIPITYLKVRMSLWKNRFSHKTNKKISKISALASKERSNQKIKALYYTN